MYESNLRQVVDYIYYSPSMLQPDAELTPFPPHATESVKANTAIPSVCYPSDHVALVQDFLWQSKRREEGAAVAVSSTDVT